MTPSGVAPKIRTIALLNRGNLPAGLPQFLESARLRVRLITRVKEIQTNDPEIGAILFPIRELSSGVILSTTRRLASRQPLVLIDDCANLHGVFVAAKVGAQELVRWRSEADQILPAIQRVWQAFHRSKPVAGNCLETVDSLNRLTRREREIIQGVANGKGNKQLALEHKISTRTVEFHRSRAMKKLRVLSLAELIRLVLLAEGKGVAADHQPPER